jgi:8-oxo-dGTP pyrophosphatase MutT (NUDIX family)
MVLHRLRRAAEPALIRLLHVYWRWARGMTLGVRGIVLDSTGRVFLVRHSYVAGWHLPGGGVETGETLREALARELFEEGNITLEEAPVLHAVYFNGTASSRDHVALFVVRAFRQDSPPVPCSEFVEHGFFAPSGLPADTTPGTRRRILEVLDGVPAADRW